MELVLKTWNCFGMAQDWYGALSGTRAPAAPRFSNLGVIGACAAVDVLCIQELFSADALLFFDGLRAHGLASAVRDDNRLHVRSRTARGSGLGIGSRHTATKTRLRRFSPRSVGWDRLARKGALYAQIGRLDGSLQLDVVTVHLQAGQTSAAVAVRASQLAELARFVEEVASPERPFVVCGDFNIDGLGAELREAAEYRRIRAALPGFEDLGEADDRPTFDPHPERNTLAWSQPNAGHPQRIDYIFFRPARSGPFRVECQGTCVVLDEPLPGTPPQRLGRAPAGPAYASDHFGLTATFRCLAR